MNYEAEYEFGYDDSTKYECEHGVTGNCFECNKTKEAEEAERTKQAKLEIAEFLRNMNQRTAEENGFEDYESYKNWLFEKEQHQIESRERCENR